MSAAANWEWIPDEQEERSSLIESFIHGATVDGEVLVEEEDEGEELEWDGRSKSRYDGAPEGGFGGGDRRSISVSPVVAQYHGENWINRVNCKDMGTLFFSGAPGAVTSALETCRRCEVLVECRTDALDRGDLYYGVVGGMTPSARRRAVNEHRRKP